MYAEYEARLVVSYEVPCVAPVFHLKRGTIFIVIVVSAGWAGHKRPNFIVDELTRTGTVYPVAFSGTHFPHRQRRPQEAISLTKASPPSGPGLFCATLARFWLLFLRRVLQYPTYHNA